jgi:hypothetical protein
MSGHLLEPNMIIPFSIDRSSLGRELAAHIFVVTGSSKRSFIEMFSLKVILRAWIPVLHSSSSYCLKTAVNGPLYDIPPAATKQLPIMNS